MSTVLRQVGLGPDETTRKGKHFETDATRETGFDISVASEIMARLAPSLALA